MYYYIKVMYQQWSNGQETFEAVTRVDEFIALAHKTYGFPQAEIKEYLESQDWYKRSLDHK